MRAERDAVLSKYKNVKTEEYGGVIFYLTHDFVGALSGIGKVNAAHTTALILSRYKPDAIFSMGVSGGLGRSKIMDIVIADRVCQHDFDLSPLGEARGLYYSVDPKMLAKLRRILPNAKVGTVATGDQFIASSVVAKEIAKTFDAIACDMEAAAIASVARGFGTPFACIRAVSDNPDGSAPDNFEKFTEEASSAFASAFIRFLENF